MSFRGFYTELDNLQSGASQSVSLADYRLGLQLCRMMCRERRLLSAKVTSDGMPRISLSTAYQRGNIAEIVPQQISSYCLLPNTCHICKGLRLLVVVGLPQIRPTIGASEAAVTGLPHESLPSPQSTTTVDKRGHILHDHSLVFMPSSSAAQIDPRLHSSYTSTAVPLQPNSPHHLPRLPPLQPARESSAYSGSHPPHRSSLPPSYYSSGPPPLQAPPHRNPGPPPTSLRDSYHPAHNTRSDAHYEPCERPNALSPITGYAIRESKTALPEYLEH